MELKLNLGRSCLKLLIRIYGIKEIFVPYYSCKTIWQSIKEENCKIKFYHIDENFMPTTEFQPDDFILYINYFGLCEKNTKLLTQNYKNLIVDNTHGFYSPSCGLASFNSYRKFFPVQNGGSLYICDEFSSDKNFIKLINNLEIDNLNLKYESFSENYENFKNNELLLNNEPIKKISHNVLEKMKTIDFDKDKKLRQKIYNKYNKTFDKYNLIKLPELKNQTPYCYPFCTDNKEVFNKLCSENSPVLRLWDDIPKHFPEYKFLNNVGALPLCNDN